jgi:hypothetical protein
MRNLNVRTRAGELLSLPIRPTHISQFSCCFPAWHASATCIQVISGDFPSSLCICAESFVLASHRSCCCKLQSFAQPLLTTSQTKGFIRCQLARGPHIRKRALSWVFSPSGRTFNARNYVNLLTSEVCSQGREREQWPQ